MENAAMSLIGKDHAFITLGVSCQTATQLHAHAKHISSLVGDDLAECSTFLNWVFISAGDIAKVVDRLISAPITVDSIVVPTAPQEALKFENFNVWFWHDKFSHEVGEADLVEIASKYEHLRLNFLKLLEKPIRYIMLSNTQNNVEDFYPFKSGAMKIHLDAGMVSEIAEAPWAGGTELITMSYQRRWIGETHKSVTVLPEDASIWEGDPAIWSDALRLRLTQPA